MLSQRRKYGWRTWEWWWVGFDVDRPLHVRDLPEYWSHVYHVLDSNGFDWRIWSVASLGFLASSYSLFATSIIWPALAYLYPQSIDGWDRENGGQGIDLVTLGGTIIGMVFFGILADNLGRKALYGIELVIITFATLGIALSSEGYMAPPKNGDSNGEYQFVPTMNIFKAVMVWRGLLGVGIGAEYSMTAIISAEYVKTSTRGTTIASVFWMQSWGRLFALLFSYLFLINQGINPEDDKAADFKMQIGIDKTWRFVAGFGGVFAISAIIMRFTVPESPRYHPLMADVLIRAMDPPPPPVQIIYTADDMLDQNNGPAAQQTLGDKRDPHRSAPWFRAVKRYLINNHKWKPLLIMCIQWFILDVVFYGTGLDSPSTLNLMWLSEMPPPDPATASNGYANDPANLNATAYQVIEKSQIRSLKVSSATSLIGGLGAIILVNYISRKAHLVWTSLVLCVTFFLMSILFWTQYTKPGSLSSVVFFGFAQFMFNLGPNTVIFILAAEIWPSIFRGTFYSLAAAFGKAGAMLIRPLVSLAIKRVNHERNPKWLGGLFILYGFLMLLIALIAHFDAYYGAHDESCIPKVQSEQRREKDPGKWLPAPLDNIVLEEIAREFPAGYLHVSKDPPRSPAAADASAAAPAPALDEPEDSGIPLNNLNTTHYQEPQEQHGAGKPNPRMGSILWKVILKFRAGGR